MFFRGQVSIEYLIIIFAFFASLAVVLPSIDFALKGYLSASDSILAKNISLQLSEECDLFSFLGDSSSKTFQYSPSAMVSIYANNGKGVVFASDKKYYFECANVNFSKLDFNKKFSVLIQKNNGVVSLSFD